MSNPKILMTFDVEEFDLPLEYGQNISFHEQLETGIKGLESLIQVWDKYPLLHSTLFTTAQFALSYPGHIHALSAKHEIASHTYFHHQFKNEDLILSRRELEKICKVPVRGLRMPRMKKIDINEVKKAGYLYDSSLNPTWLPGRYNYLHKPRLIHKENDTTIVPASVSPTLRFPLFWLAFKNYPYSLFLYLCKQTLLHDGYLCLYFHPWEFTDLKKYKLPFYIKKPDGDKLIEKLEKLIVDLSAYGEFTSVFDYLTSANIIPPEAGTRNLSVEK